MPATEVHGGRREQPVSTVRRLREIQLSLQRLSMMDAIPRIVAATPHELCLAGGFDRAMFSYIRGDRIIFGSVSDDQHPVMAADFARLARAVRPRLERCGPEHEAVVRQMPVLVRHAQETPGVFRPLVHVARTAAYVSAPVVWGRQTVALVHADRFESRDEVDELDRELLWTFAAGLGWIMDRVAARAGLPSAHPDGDGRPVLEGPHDGGEPDATRARLASLTSRELEVLGLMAEGSSNAAIGEALVISQATVKSHVRHILRKLRAGNRTEAVSQYLATRVRVSLSP